MKKLSILTVGLLVFAFAGIVSSAAKGHGETMSQEHRSEVADIVQKLTDIAGRDNNIGKEVREVAKEQSNVASKSAEEIKEVEGRSGWKTFFIGTDWKNIGQLRSELVTTANHIDRLIKAKERATSQSVKDDLDAQIKALEEIKAKVEAFIKDNEGKFSLLGWLVRLFNR